MRGWKIEQKVYDDLEEKGFYKTDYLKIATIIEAGLV